MEKAHEPNTVRDMVQWPTSLFDLT